MESVKEAARLVDWLRGKRAEREAKWRKLSRWICPWRGRFEGAPERGDGRERFTFAASSAALRGASGMTSGCTPRNIAWYKPTFMDAQLLELAGARAWLDEVDRRIGDALAEGGFYQAIQNFNLDLIWAGCALLYTETGSERVFFTQCLQAGSYLVATDSRGGLEYVARRLTYQGAEALRVFGAEKLSAGLKTRIAKNPLEEVKVWHLTCPGRGNIFAWDSFYWEDGGREFLKTGGYHEMPYFFAVWNEGETAYGTGPGDNCLADAMQMDILERHKLSGLGRLVDPPVAAPHALKDALNLAPGAINYASERDIIRPILDMSPYAAAMRGLQEEIATVAGRLEQGLMAAIFASMPLTQRPAGMSATEFLERKRECLQQLGPVMAAYEPNVLSPLLLRCALALERAGLLPPPPKDLAQVPLFMKMDFISPMANALRQTGAETTRALFQDIAAMFQATQRPELFDKIDLDQMADELATGLGAPGAIVRADAEVAKIRSDRAKAQAQQQQAALAMQASQADNAPVEQERGGQLL